MPSSRSRCGGAARAEPPRFASFTFENDFFAGYDRHYTNGMQIAFLTDIANAPAVLRENGPLAWSADPQVVLAIGQRIYTPTNTDISPPDPNDRPYAGWLYLMTDVRTRAAPTIDHLTLTLGMVGPASGARQTQDLVHSGLGEVESEGWDTPGAQPRDVHGGLRARVAGHRVGRFRRRSAGTSRHAPVRRSARR